MIVNPKELPIYFQTQQILHSLYIPFDTLQALLNDI